MSDSADYESLQDVPALPEPGNSVSYLVDGARYTLTAPAPGVWELVSPHARGRLEADGTWFSYRQTGAITVSIDDDDWRGILSKV